MGVGGTGVGVGGGAVGVGVGAGVGTGVGGGVGAGVGGFGVGLGARAGVGVGLRVATGVGVGAANVGVGGLADPTALGEARGDVADGLGAPLDSSLDGPQIRHSGRGSTAFLSPTVRRPPSRAAQTQTASMAMATANAATTPAMRRWRPRELAGWACNRRRSGSWPRTGVVGAGGSTGMAGGWACSAVFETTRRVGMVGAGAPATPIR